MECPIAPGSTRVAGKPDSGPKCAHSWNQIQTLKKKNSVTSIALICGRAWPRLIHPPAQSLIRSPVSLLGMIVEMQIEILDDEEILVN